MVKVIRKIKRNTARMIVKHRMCRNGKLTIARDKLRRKRMSCFLLTLAFLLLVIPGFVMLRHRISTIMTESETTAQNQELYTVGTIIYRHLHGYPTYCRKKGYTLKNYVKVFIDTHEDDLVVFDLISRENGLTPNTVISEIKNAFSPVVQKSIRKEFGRIRQRGLMTQDNQPIKTDVQICRYLDENTRDWFQTAKKADIEQIHTFAKSFSED